MEEQTIVPVHPQIKQELFGRENQEGPSSAIIRQAKAEFKQMKKYAGLRVQGKRGKQAWLGKRCRELMAAK
jgi:hypothetical protein